MKRDKIIFLGLKLLNEGKASTAGEAYDMAKTLLKQQEKAKRQDPKKQRYFLTAGRTITNDKGEPLFYLNPVENTEGKRYTIPPIQADAVSHFILDYLNQEPKSLEEMEKIHREKTWQGHYFGE